MNDREAAERITNLPGLAGDAEKLRELQQHLEQSPSSRALSEVLRQIDRALEITDNGQQTEPGPGLSQVSKSRMSKRLADELSQFHARESTGDYQQAAEEPADYRQGDAGSNGTTDQSTT